MRDRECGGRLQALAPISRFSAHRRHIGNGWHCYDKLAVDRCGQGGLSPSSKIRVSTLNQLAWVPMFLRSPDLLDVKRARLAVWGHVGTYAAQGVDVSMPQQIEGAYDLPRAVLCKKCLEQVLLVP